MSVRVLSWVFDHSTVEHRGDLLVLLVLADHAHDDGSSAYPSVDTIARKARLSRRGAYDALKRLKAEGAIVPDGRGPKGTIAYRIIMQGGAAIAPVQPLHGAVSDTEGVQSLHEGGAVTAPEPSLTVSEPSSPSRKRSGGAREGADREQRPPPRDGVDVDARTPPPGSAAPPSPAQRVFDAWVEATGKQRAVFDDKRRRLVSRQLKLYPVEDLIGAVRGWRYDPHNRGENDRGRPFNDLALLLRDADHIERFRDLERQHRGGGRGMSARLGAALKSRTGERL